MRVPSWFLVVAACSSSVAPSPPPARDPVAPADATAERASDVAPGVATGPPDAAVPTIAIVDTPMVWSPAREALTLEYRRMHSDASATDVAIAPQVIILHYTGGGSATATRRYFDHLRIEAERSQLAAGGAVNVSAHFVVDRDGTIYRLQPETRFARHCIGMNHVAIGIENVGDESRWKLTPAQVVANAALVRHLAARFLITHVLGHHEVMGMRSDPLFVELDPGYRNRKGDPGPRFMTAVRARIGDLALAGAPP